MVWHEGNLAVCNYACLRPVDDRSPGEAQEYREGALGVAAALDATNRPYTGAASCSEAPALSCIDECL